MPQLIYTRLGLGEEIFEECKAGTSNRYTNLILFRYRFNTLMERVFSSLPYIKGIPFCASLSCWRDGIFMNICNPFKLCTHLFNLAVCALRVEEINFYLTPQARQTSSRYSPSGVPISKSSFIKSSTLLV